MSTLDLYYPIKTELPFIMKIFIVCSRLGFGGAEHVGVMLANGFADRGHISYLLSNTNEEICFPVNKNVNLYGIFPKSKNKIIKWIKAIFNTRSFLKKESPEVVIAIAETCSFISYLACTGLNIPIIYTAHNSFERPSSAPMGRWNKIAKYWLGRLYSKVTVLTEADKTFIGNRLKNVSVMPNPLELIPIHEIPIKQNAVLAAGRLDAWHVKGFDILLQAWSKIMKNEENEKMRNANWWLKIAGAGKLESFEYLMSILEDSDFKFQASSDGQKIWRSEKYHVEFLGFQKDIKKLYQEASIFVLSSRYEGFGLVLIEAMSQGCACVACDYKGRQREILSPLQGDSLKVNGYSDHGIEVTENGILCEPEDVEALAKAIKKMIEDDEYRERICKNAIERSKYYSIENTMDRWDRLLHDVDVMKS